MMSVLSQPKFALLQEGFASCSHDAFWERRVALYHAKVMELAKTMKVLALRSPVFSSVLKIGLENTMKHKERVFKISSPTLKQICPICQPDFLCNLITYLFCFCFDAINSTSIVSIVQVAWQRQRIPQCIITSCRVEKQTTFYSFIMC